MTEIVGTDVLQQQRLRRAKDSIHQIIGQSKAMRELRIILERVARTDATVLLYGETGSGKEAAAHYIYENYPGSGRMITIDCASLTDSLAEAELFGHAKGSFTGAVADRQGLFAEAHKGMAFFDEIGEIPLHIQPKFLRLMEDKTVRQIGGNKVSKVETKIVVGTNRNLLAEVTDGKFREDLYNRVYVIAVRLPPLREHLDDIPLLVEHFLGGGHVTATASKEALDFLKQQPWPGNVRQLKRTLERAVVFCDNRPNGVLTLEKEHFAFLEKTVQIMTRDDQALAQSLINGRYSVEEMTRLYLTALLHAGFSKAAISRIFRVDVKTIYNWAEAFGLHKRESDSSVRMIDKALSEAREAQKDVMEEVSHLRQLAEESASFSELVEKLGCSPKEMLEMYKSSGLADVLRKLL